MGYSVLYRDAEKWVKKNEREMLRKYHDLLRGKTIVELKDVEVDYYVQGKIVLDDGNTFIVHYRLSTDSEYAMKKESSDRRYNIHDYFKKYILGNTIGNVRVEVRFNEPHIVCFVPEKLEYIYISIEEYYDEV